MTRPGMWYGDGAGGAVLIPTTSRTLHRSGGDTPEVPPYYGVMGTTQNAPTELATKDGYYPISKAQRMIDGSYLVTFTIPGLAGEWRTSCDAEGRKHGYQPITRVKS